MLSQRPTLYRKPLARTDRFLLLICAFLWLASACYGEVTFRHDVMAVLSKAGCNAGTCHGNANGKAGFKLSLRGQNPEKDFIALTREQWGRRTNPVEPDKSLILLKATTQIAHEGGKRFAVDSEHYRILREWIASGTPADPAALPRLMELDVEPTEIIASAPQDSFSIRAWATFSNGERREVTDMAVYEASDTSVSVTPGGVVQRESFGETTVLVRYLHQQRPVRVTFIPQRPHFVWSQPEKKNFIDGHIFTKLKSLRMNPSPICSDEDFIRRAYLDLLGKLPEPEEARRFVKDSDPEKRARLVDLLLERPEFADFWALKWGDLLRLEERSLDSKGVQVFHRWVRDSIADNRPWDEFVQDLLASTGSTYQNPPANFYRAIRKTNARSEAVAQVFLGLRLQCAQCHNHPFDRWTQKDYYDWGSLFSRIDYKVLQNRRRDSNDGHEFVGEQVVFMAREGGMTNPENGQPAHPRFLDAEEAIDPDAVNELRELAEWVTSPRNPWFAKAQANRIWYHLMGRGLVEPIDDFRSTNPASHPALLEELAEYWVANDYSLRSLIRRIMNSRAYQLSSAPNKTNAGDHMNFSHVLPRRLSAEQMLDSQSQVLGVPLVFEGLPEGTRAAQLPGALPDKRRGRRGSELQTFLDVFGKPPRLLTCECERSDETSMSQAFLLISGPVLNDMLTDKDNRLQSMLDGNWDHSEMVDELYWAALTRAPGEQEMKRATDLLDESAPDQKRQALEDIAWSLLNAKEFLLRH